MLQVAARKWRLKTLVALTAATVIAVWAMVYLNSVWAEDRAVQKRIGRIHQLISPGMDVDKAAAKLKEAGFGVG